MALTAPLPRAPSDPLGDPVAHWYAHVLGWPVAGGPPVQLLTGVCFDVLEMPSDAGFAVLRRGIATGPVAVLGRRMRMLVAAGAADELAGLLDWLEWGGVALDLTATGAGGRITAPLPPTGAPGRSPGVPGRAGEVREGAGDTEVPETRQGAAVWLRPPEAGCEARLPAMTALGRPPGAGTPAGAPDLVRLVGAAATECHRARLLRTRSNQALAFS
ncbi:SCO3374 family protein [Streptomyces sp. 12297]|uniref:SCO3374 family protein n=1 Tax=Streptomyces sp. NBC_00239 TaxID=2903640 RepID=UPI002E2C675E|nr:SCO3374 family protein [Streptomyces sp. NBC_00239]